MTLRADPSALHVILKNLIENAIQHSPEGGSVAITVESTQVSIRDEGPGIAAEDVAHLFTRFWRGPGRQHEGAGLGLAICKEIAFTHQWQLLARNQSEGGEFVVVFA